MVKAVCGCLNVKIHIKGELITLPQFHTDNLEITESQDEFFQQVSFKLFLLYGASSLLPSCKQS